ncbi:hypothetical protein [Streptomyces orinoci]|uniref:Uncharacterized protein n=1 Tax=Streptomyces orinoci TaxID=67339 RepID=A0ABV3K7F8_STRON|nr:hypothetical protein [Streptomyces orinoci]
MSDANTLNGRPEGMRLIVRRLRPSQRQLKKPTLFEQKTGRRQIQFLDAPQSPGPWDPAQPQCPATTRPQPEDMTGKPSDRSATETH